MPTLVLAALGLLAVLVIAFVLAACRTSKAAEEDYAEVYAAYLRRPVDPPTHGNAARVP